MRTPSSITSQVNYLRKEDGHLIGEPMEVIEFPRMKKADELSNKLTAALISGKTAWT